MVRSEELYDAILNGDAKQAHAITEAALATGAAPMDLITDTMVPAMDEVGRLFETEEYFVPELLLAGRAMKSAMELLRPLMAASGQKLTTRVVIGTVKGDMHDIGKNLVASMLEGSGFEVFDLGADVPPEKFVAAVEEHSPQVICLSALLTVTMPAMKTTIDVLEAAGLRARVKILIGGAPVTGQYAKQIGADGYSESASGAVSWCGRSLQEHETMIGRTIRKYSKLTISSAERMLYGVSPHPLRCGLGLTIGGGLVYPEVNFTLPPMNITEQTWTDVLAHYEQMASEILRRAAALAVPGIVLEFELLPAMTERPEWGAEITALLKRKMRECHEKSHLPCALRVTPVDIRDQFKPPQWRTGHAWEQLRQSLQLCAKAGADILSIESVGGKEVHDQALMYGDFQGIVFALGVLAPRDMSWLWGQIGEICDRHPGVVPGGDSACGFANTAMQLAHQKMLPEVLAAVVRAMSAVRSLAAFEQCAVGPSKDCAYEGPVLKAITGFPISMEGKSASCAHFSPLGNIAAGMCDLWSNESVQNVRLLSGNAPEVFTELLAYDCRLMNAAAASEGGALQMRNWMTASDEWLSPQAAVLSPDATIKIAKAIVNADTPYRRTIAAGRAAVQILNDGIAEGKLRLSRKEQQWLTRIGDALDAFPADEETLMDEMDAQYESFYDKSSYGLKRIAASA